MPTHYETLGVARSAQHDDIRRAYHEAARRFHPDRSVGRPEADQAAAADSMRAVNEAWHVLRDPERRRAYNSALDGPASRATRDGNTIRIDPRLIDPDVLEARRQAQYESTDTAHGVLLRVFPVMALLGLLVGIFVFTAYANTRGDTGSPSVPLPDIGVAGGDCVRVLPGPQLLAVPCDAATIDGRVLAVVELGADCPGTTLDPVDLPAKELTVCLG